MRKMIMVIGLSLLLVVPTHMDAKEVYFRHGSKDSGKARTVLPQVTGDLEAEELTLDMLGLLKSAYLTIMVIWYKHILK